MWLSENTRSKKSCVTAESLLLGLLAPLAMTPIFPSSREYIVMILLFSPYAVPYDNALTFFGAYQDTTHACQG